MTPLRYPLGGMPPQQKPGMPAQGGKGGRPMPAQGGKGLSRTLPPPGQGSTMPPQGGKGQNFGPNVFPAPQVQQPQVPAQGGKAPLTQEQLAAMGQPQVQQPVGGFPQPQVMPANMAPQQGLAQLQQMLAGKQ